MATLPPEGDGLVTFILTVILLVLCWPTVIARFLVRMKIKALGLDDWLMGIGMVMSTAWAGVLFVYCLSCGGYQPDDERVTPALATRALKVCCSARHGPWAHVHSSTSSARACTVQQRFQSSLASALRCCVSVALALYSSTHYGRSCSLLPLQASAA